MPWAKKRNLVACPRCAGTEFSDVGPAWYGHGWTNQRRSCDGCGLRVTTVQSRGSTGWFIK